MGCSIYFLSGPFLGGKEHDKSRQTVFFSPLDPFGNNPDEEKHHDDLHYPSEGTIQTLLETQSRCSMWDNFSRAQDKGLQFWQKKSFATITHDNVPGECIHKVISRNGDRVLFERIATPRPATKVTLKSNWRLQQQQ